MANKLTEGFYKTAQWVNCRNSYAKSVGGICERCYKDGIIKHGEIVHHKIHITPENVHNPEITLNFANLELLCRDHHAEVHKKQQKRFLVDTDGKIRPKPDHE